MGISLRQIRHEWVSVLCQCIALSAVIMPVLLMLGLKNGIISSEWRRLMNDPDTLLLAPHFSSTRREVSFIELQEIAKFPGVQTIIPRLSTLDSQVFLYSDKKPLDPQESWSQATQLVLTKAGDKTLTYYGCPIPVFQHGQKWQEAVLNHVESERLLAPIGSTIHMTGYRISQGKRETFDLPLKVVGVLPPDNKSSDITNAQKVYVSEKIAFAVLDYYAGLPGFLTGEQAASPPPACRALLMIPDKETAHLHALMKKRKLFLDRQGVPIPWKLSSFLPSIFPSTPLLLQQRGRISPNTALTYSTQKTPSFRRPPASPSMTLLRQQWERFFPGTALTYSKGGTLITASQWNEQQSEFLDDIPLTPLPNHAFLLFPPQGKGMAYQAYYARYILPAVIEGMGEKWRIYPWNSGVKITYVTDKFEQGSVTSPWNDPDLLEKLSSRRSVRQCNLYTGASDAAPTTPRFTRNDPNPLEIKIHTTVPGRAASHAVVNIVTVPGLNISPPHYFCAPEDLGILSLASQFPYNWDYRKPQNEAFIPIDRQFGFRCYADSIENVAAVKKSLEDKGFTCVSSQADIAKNKTLDANLSRLLMVISALGGSGALIALVLNLFNATERRKKDYAILRTLGLGRMALVALPIYETVVIMTLTLTFSFGLYHGLAILMSHSFADMLPSGGTLCEIPLRHQVLILLGTLSLAAFSAFCSSLRLCRLSPAAYIRES